MAQQQLTYGVFGLFSSWFRLSFGCIVGFTMSATLWPLFSSYQLDYIGHDPTPSLHLLFSFRSMLKLLDVLVQLDHLKNAKASLPNDFSWYKRYGNHLICIRVSPCVA